MLKSLFALIVASLAILCIVKENAAVRTVNDDESHSTDPPSIEKYEPFVVVTSSLIYRLSKMKLMLLSDIYKLPTEFIQQGEKLSLALEPDDRLNLRLCPEFKTETEMAKITLKALNLEFPATKKCLFLRSFEDNEQQMCDEEPQLSLDKRKENESSVTCGINDDQQLVDAQYNNCGTENDVMNYSTELAKHLSLDDQKKIKFPPYKPAYHLIYEICYDFRHKKTLWTRHSPMTPALLAHPKSPYKNLTNEFKIEDFKDDTSSLDLENSTFKKLKKSYLNTDPRITTAFTMVPKDHMALPYWKKATTHIINAAPLSPKFIPLMETINNGIFLASSNLFVKSKKILQVYTHAETNFSTVKNLMANVNSAIFKTSVPFMTKKPDLFERNIWYRFIYDQSEELGALIVLHNTKENLPQEKECDHNERLPCDFEKWSNSPEPIPSDILNHAYCCKTTEDRVKQLFSLKELVLKGDFDIQKMIDYKPTEPDENPGTNANKDQESDQ